MARLSQGDCDISHPNSLPCYCFGGEKKKKKKVSCDFPYFKPNGLVFWIALIGTDTSLHVLRTSDHAERRSYWWWQMLFCFYLSCCKMERYRRTNAPQHHPFNKRQHTNHNIHEPPHALRNSVLLPYLSLCCEEVYRSNALYTILKLY